MTNMCRLRSMVFGSLVPHTETYSGGYFLRYIPFGKMRKKNIFVDLHHDFLVTCTTGFKCINEEIFERYKKVR